MTLQNNWSTFRTTLVATTPSIFSHVRVSPNQYKDGHTFPEKSCTKRRQLQGWWMAFLISLVPGTFHSRNHLHIFSNGHVVRLSICGKIIFQRPDCIKCGLQIITTTLMSHHDFYVSSHFKISLLNRFIVSVITKRLKHMGLFQWIHIKVTSTSQILKLNNNYLQIQ